MRLLLGVGTGAVPCALDVEVAVAEAVALAPAFGHHDQLYNHRGQIIKADCKSFRRTS